MRATVIAVLALVAVAMVSGASASRAALVAGADTVENQFALFQHVYGRTYASETERAVRFEVFQQNMERAALLNKQEEGTAKYGASPYADMTPYEFRSRYLMRAMDAGDAKNSCLAHGVTAPKHMFMQDPPASFDWRTKNAVSPVKDQAQCGSCWAFSTTGVIESMWFLKGNSLVQLSEQAIVDCSHDCSLVENQLVCNSGCEGGWPWAAALTIMNQGGLDSESSYPYRGVDGKCHTTKANYAAHISNYTCLGTDETEMASYLAANGPLSIAMNADLLQSYVSGIIKNKGCEKDQLDHAILIVGYGMSGTTPYWIVKNSWGKSWGEQGYFRIVRGSGECGVNNAVMSVIV